MTNFGKCSAHGNNPSFVTVSPVFLKYPGGVKKEVSQIVKAKFPCCGITRKAECVGFLAGVDSIEEIQHWKEVELVK